MRTDIVKNAPSYLLSPLPDYSHSKDLPTPPPTPTDREDSLLSSPSTYSSSSSYDPTDTPKSNRASLHVPKQKETLSLGETEGLCKLLTALVVSSVRLDNEEEVSQAAARLEEESGAKEEREGISDQERAEWNRLLSASHELWWSLQRVRRKRIRALRPTQDTGMVTLRVMKEELAIQMAEIKQIQQSLTAKPKAISSVTSLQELPVTVETDGEEVLSGNLIMHTSADTFQTCVVGNPFTTVCLKKPLLHIFFTYLFISYFIFCSIFSSFPRLGCSSHVCIHITSIRLLSILTILHNHSALSKLLKRMPAV